MEFSFIILFALLGTVLSIRLRQPYVVGLLLFGMVAGPNVLGLVSDKVLISTFSELGAILLLFTVGIEFSVSRILKSGLRAIAITIFKMSALFIVGYETALAFGLDATASLYVGAMLSITSTTIMFKIVAEKGMAKNPTMPLLFSMLIVEDIVAVSALTFFSALGAESQSYSWKIYSVLIALGVLGAFYVFVRKHLSDALYRLTSDFNAEVQIFVSFSLCLVMSMFAGFFGLSPAIGAFLAGSIVSSLPNSRSIEKTIRPLLLMFAALFFLSLGMGINPSVVMDNLALSLSLAAIFALVCFTSVFMLLYNTGSSSKNALFGASSMVVIGEFSLLIASVAKGAYAPVLLAAGSFGVVATALLSSFLLGRQGQLFSMGQRSMPPGARNAAHKLSSYLTGLVRDFSPGGSFWKVSRVCWACVRTKMGQIAIIAIMVFASRFFVKLAQLPDSTSVQLRAALAIAGVIPMLYLIYLIFRDLSPVLDALSRTIARNKRDAKAESAILRDLAVVLLLILVSLNVHPLVDSLQLPSVFKFADDLFFLFILGFGWDIVIQSGKLHKKRVERARKLLRKLSG